MKKTFTLLLLAALCLTASAESWTIVCSETFAQSATSATSGTFSFTTEQGTGTSWPTFNTRSNDLRLYAGNSITISTTGTPFKSIVFVLSDKGIARQASIECSQGEMSQESGASSITWNAADAVTDVTFVVGGSATYGTETGAGQFDFTAFTISTEPADAPQPGNHFESDTFMNIIYWGEEGSQWTVSDDLYVAFAAPDGMVYVTDNQDQYYDEWYDDWFDWYPQWAAIDCSNNDALWSALSQATTITGGTFSFTLQDTYTNPRLVPEGDAPTLTTATLPDLKIYAYNLNEPIGPLGNEIAAITGTYTQGMLTGTTSDGIVQQVTVNSDYLQEGQLQEGCECTMTAVVKISEEWEETTTLNAPRRVRANNGPRRYKYFDPTGVGNYTFYPIVVDMATGVSAPQADAQIVDTTYVNALGQSSDRPFNGMNIVVTRYSDGTTATKKVIR